MARINVTQRAVRQALEAYRGSRKINPIDRFSGQCVNLQGRRRCLVSQVLSDLGVRDEHLDRPGGVYPLMYSLYEAGVVTKRSTDRTADFLAEVQALADGRHQPVQWGKVVATVLDEGIVF